MKQLILIIFIALGLGSCETEGIRTERPINNSNFEITLLFEYDSIKMYRFEDNGRLHYFTKFSTQSYYSCGKNCTAVETIELK